MYKKILYLLLFTLIIGTGCIRQTTEPDPPPSHGALQGTVTSDGNVVHPSYIFMGDSLIAESGLDGAYQIDALTSGTIQITCSALSFADTTVGVTIQGDETTLLDFDLTPDSTKGFLIGEFQDDSLFQQRLLEDPSLTDWTDKEICDAFTGATIQYKTLKPFIPYSYVYLGDDSLIRADNWGQYAIQIQCGTYPFTAICNEYQTVTGVVRVVPEGHPDGRAYLNFFLPRDN